MFKKTLAVAALAIATTVPAHAASLPTALAGLASAGRDATRVYVLPTGSVLIPPLKRFKALQPVSSGSPNQPFPPLPGLSTLTSAGSQGAAKLSGLASMAPKLPRRR